jgi:hypothetical protein
MARFRDLPVLALAVPTPALVTPSACRAEPMREHAEEGTGQTKQVLRRASVSAPPDSRFSGPGPVADPNTSAALAGSTIDMTGTCHSWAQSATCLRLE